MTRYTTHGRRWTQQRELARDMRRVPTGAEDALWDRLRSKRLGGLKFRRQHPVGQFILDFYCAERGLAIEVDGAIQDVRAEQDRARQEYLEQRGIRFRRCTNDEVLGNIDQLLSIILSTLDAPAPPLHDVERGLGGEVQPQRKTPLAESAE